MPIDLSKLPDKKIDLSGLPDKPKNIDLSNLPDKGIKIDLSRLPDKPQNTIISRFKEHPYKSILTPYGLTGVESFSELAKGTIPDWAVNIIPPVTPFRKEETRFRKEVIGSLTDMPLTPATYLLPIAGGLVKNIPVAGTTLGRVATEVPVGKGFVKSVKELGRYEQALKNLPARVAASQAPLQISQKATNAVQKITQALKETVIPTRAEQEALYTAERGKRLAMLQQAEKVGGEQGYIEKLKALTGELPKAKYEGLRGKITQTDVDDLFSIIEQQPDFTSWDKLNAQTGLRNLLASGKVPTEGEIKLLSRVFPQEFIQSVLDNRTTFSKLFGLGEDALNVNKSLMASMDLSMTLRQAFFLSTRHPIIAAKAFPKQVKYFFSEKAYQGLIKDIHSRANFPLMQESGLSLTDMLTGREERFMSQMAEKIPFVGKLVRGSNRAATGYLNKLRADVFDYLATKNKLLDNPVELKGIAHVINNATGRGNLPEIVEGSAKLLNGVLFSPRLVSSRINFLNPYYYITLPPVARKEALQILFTTTGFTATVLGLAKASGAEVGMNPYSADFLKFKIKGKPYTRFEITGGLQQYLRAGFQLIGGKHISSVTGVETRVGEGYKPMTRLEIAQRLIETKTSPLASFALALLKGKGFAGKELDIPKEVAMRFIPMVIQDAYDLIKEGGLKDLGMVAPALLGVGVQTYTPTPEDMVSAMKSVETSSTQLKKESRFQEAKELRNKNKEIIRIGRALERQRSMINTYERSIRNLERNPSMSKEQKSKRILAYRERIKTLQAKMEERYQSLKK